MARLLESGQFGIINELAAAKKIKPSRVSRVLLLTLLAQDIVATILNGLWPEQVCPDLLLRPFPMDWHEPRARLPVAALSIAVRIA